MSDGFAESLCSSVEHVAIPTGGLEITLSRSAFIHIDGGNLAGGPEMISLSYRGQGLFPVSRTLLLLERILLW